MQDKVTFIFWDGPFRLLSTGPLGVECTSRQEAVQMLLDSIAAHESTVGYLNQIYDNAQVELQSDNMQSITVLDHYYVQDIYIQHKAADIADTVLTYDSPGGEQPVGLAYAPKGPDAYRPDFTEALRSLMAEMRRRGAAYRQEEKELMDS